jgi:hypothetical protein
VRLFRLFGPEEPPPVRSVTELSGVPEDSYVELWRRFTGEIEALEIAHVEAQRYLLTEDRDVCLSRIHDALRRAVTLDEQHQKDLLTHRLAEAVALIHRQGSRRVLREYTRGLYRCVLATLGVLLLLGLLSLAVLWLFYAPRHAPIPPEAILALSQSLICIGGGAVGATLSVLIRIRSTRELDYRSSGIHAAVVRVILGWFFAVGLLVLVKSNIVTIFAVPTDEVAAWFFWAAVGFLAGFNERWAQDLVTRNKPNGTAVGWR